MIYLSLAATEDLSPLLMKFNELLQSSRLEILDHFNNDANGTTTVVVNAVSFDDARRVYPLALEFFGNTCLDCMWIYGKLGK
jgi:hypothetical protein